jgi:hypothetical protein
MSGGSEVVRLNESKRGLFENAASLDGIFSPKSVALVHTGLPGAPGADAISTFLGRFASPIVFRPTNCCRCLMRLRQI